MPSSWGLLCKIVIGLEGILGLVLSLLLVFIKLTMRTETTVLAYRCCIAINASQGAFNCILLISGLWAHVLSDGYFLAIVYGPVQLAPKWDIIVSLAVFMVFSLWQFIAAPCIVQKCMRNTRRIGIAYLFTALSMTISARYFWLFIPNPEVEVHIWEIAKRIHQLEDSDRFVVYGVGLREDPVNGSRSAFDLAFYGIAPSYLLTYAAFGFAVLKIVRELARVNTGMSTKTMELQRTFIRMQIVQGFIPLAILAIPFNIFISSIITGANLDKWTLMLTFSLWSLPAVQASAPERKHKDRVLRIDVAPTSQIIQST